LGQYLEHMDRIVARTAFVEAFLYGDGNALHPFVTVETVYLQLRNVLEEIAVASLSVNRKALKKLDEEGKRKWHAWDILDAVKAVNPLHFPGELCGFRMPRGHGHGIGQVVSPHWQKRPHAMLIDPACSETDRFSRSALQGSHPMPPVVRCQGLDR